MGGFIFFVEIILKINHQLRNVLKGNVYSLLFYRGFRYDESYEELMHEF